ncbi:Uncharacterized protein FWK35_00015851 [Aphis craccivora]|uniref:Uncharacterized protein n=1 Tax=Aphis craccivora TaxID=307492 RepID=A0A6G0YF74_APHCR|nr:Uncharacterized protein FWK35_00015851 [Aphis craccivora]
MAGVAICNGVRHKTVLFRTTNNQKAHSTVLNAVPNGNDAMMTRHTNNLQPISNNFDNLNVRTNADSTAQIRIAKQTTVETLTSTIVNKIQPTSSSCGTTTIEPALTDFTTLITQDDYRDRRTERYVTPHTTAAIDPALPPQIGHLLKYRRPEFFSAK